MVKSLFASPRLATHFGIKALYHLLVTEPEDWHKVPEE